MRTGRSLTVCWGGLPAGGSPYWGWGVSLPGGFPCWGVLPAGGSPCPGVYLLGGVSLLGRLSLPETPPWAESQTPVKTLPWPNFVAAGNYITNEMKGTKWNNRLLFYLKEFFRLIQSIQQKQTSPVQKVRSGCYTFVTECLLLSATKFVQTTRMIRF